MYFTGQGGTGKRAEAGCHPVRTLFDALRRTTFVAENWHDFDGADPTAPSGTGDAIDQSRDRASRFVYNGTWFAVQTRGRSDRSRVHPESRLLRLHSFR